MRGNRVLAGLALAAAGSACVLAGTAGAAGKTVVVKTRGGERYVSDPLNPPNKINVNNLAWAPGTITVHSGQRFRLVDGDHTGEPHVLVISLKRDLPKVNTNPATNPVLRMIAPALLVDPANPEAGFKAFKANAGPDGLNQEGDALVVVAGTPHRTATWFVSAKPGTVLYYFCAVHLWMQGKIKVVK